jgi:hypothetical protein
MLNLRDPNPSLLRRLSSLIAAFAALLEDHDVDGSGAPLPLDIAITIDTPVGYRLQSLRKKAAIQLMGSRLWGRFNPNHWDPVYAAATGLKAPIQTGEMSSAYIAEMCVNHFGPDFFRGARVVCKYVASTYADEIISTHGVVREKTPKGAGFRFIVDVWAENEAGEKKTAGRVEVDVGV